MKGSKRSIWMVATLNALVLGMASALVVAAGCGHGSSGGTMGPSTAPTATPLPAGTPTKTPVVVSAAGTTFSPNSLTVPSGTAVTFNCSGHTVNIDDGTGTGTCSATDLVSFPASHTFTGASGTVFRIHCDIHSSCGASSCSGCTGMTMTITLQ
jgi:plastocyanin